MEGEPVVSADVGAQVNFFICMPFNDFAAILVGMGTIIILTGKMLEEMAVRYRNFKSDVLLRPRYLSV